MWWALTQQGYTVLEAVDGLDGVRVSEEHSGAIHLLLTDLVMPRLSGQKLAARLLAARLLAVRPGLKVLFMTGYTEEEVLRHDLDPKVSDMVRKPFKLDHLSRKVRDLLDRQ